MAALTETWALQFADEWIAAWNSHDLERILVALYGDSVAEGFGASVLAR